MTEETKDVEFEVATREENSPAEVFGSSYGGMLTPEMVARAEAAVAMVSKVKAIALRVTNHQDWQKFGDKAYLNESGSKKLAALWGVSLSNGKIVEIKTKDEEGNPVIKYSAHVTASIRGRSIEEIGESDTKDDFFRFRWKDGARTEIPFSELDLTSIKKKAYTNALGRAVKTLLGYGNVTWAEVNGNVQESSKSAQVSYKTASPAKAQTVASAEGVASEEAMKAKVREMVFALASEDEESAKRMLLKYSSFVSPKDGKEVSGFASIQDKKCAGKWLVTTYGKIKKDYELSGLGGPPTEEREPGMEG